MREHTVEWLHELSAGIAVVLIVLFAIFSAVAWGIAIAYLLGAI